MTMTKRELRKAIDDAFFAIDRLADASTETSRLIQRAFEAAETEERGHRRFGPNFASHHPGALSVAHCARYFVVKWVFDESGLATQSPDSWLAAAQVRSDTLYSYALRQALRTLPPKPAWLASVEYGHLVGTP